MAEINLKKDEYEISRTVAMKFGRAVIDEALIVPDVKPDIKKVLDVSARAYITDVTPGQDKVHVEGTVKASVLYLPEGGATGMVKALDMSREFNTAVDAKGVTPDSRISAEAEIESLDATLINSRKVNVRAGVNIGVKICKNEKLELPTDIEEEREPAPPLGDLLPFKRREQEAADSGGKNHDIQLQKTPVRLAGNQFTSDGSIIIRGEHEISNKLPQIGDVLCGNASVEPEKAVMTDGNADLSGTVKVSLLYEDETDPDGAKRGGLRTVEFSLPYDESFEAPKAKDDMECDVEYNVREIYTEVMDNADGERRVLGVEIVIGVSVSGYEIFEPGVISDGYCLGGGELRPEFSETAPEQLVESMSAQISCKCSLKRRPTDAPITGVCSLTAPKTSVDDIDISGGMVNIKGVVTVKALCCSNDEGQPLFPIETTAPFDHSFDISGIKDLGGKAACDAKVFVNHLSYNITGPDTVEARMLIGISVKLIKSDRIRIVNSFEHIEPEDSRGDGMQSYIIYFVQPGDTLWNIAKRYKTTVDDIAAMSGITDPDNLSIGQKIRIKA